jgi:hypothetical protein
VVALAIRPPGLWCKKDLFRKNRVLHEHNPSIDGPRARSRRALPRQRLLIGWLVFLVALGPIDVLAGLGGAAGEWLDSAPAHAGSRGDGAGKQRSEQAGKKRAQAGKKRTQAGKKRAQAGKKRAQAGKKRAQAGKKRAQARKKRAQARKKPTNMPGDWQWPPSEQMKREGKRCLERLDELGVAWKKAGTTRKVVTPIVVPSMMFGAIKLTSIFRKPPFVMDCHLAEALAVHGQILYDQGVRELRFSSIHSYRSVRRKGYNGKALSRHALGLAMDVYAFVLDDGTRLVVEQDYHQDAGTVLREAEDAMNATGGFRTLLTPRSDPRSHYDHFHFEARIPGSRTAQAR